MRTVFLVFLMLLAVTSNGCQWGTMDDEEFDRRYGDRLKGPGGVSMFYGSEAMLLADTLTNTFGPDALIRSLSVSYNRAYFEVQTQNDKSRQLRYTYEDGDLEPAEDSSPISESDAKEFVRLADIPLKDLPQLVQKAHNSLGQPGVFVRMVNISLDRKYPEYLEAIAKADPAEFARLRRSFLGPEAGKDDKGVRFMFFFGESSASSRVETDSEGRTLEVNPHKPVEPGKPEPQEQPVLFETDMMVSASERLLRALGGDEFSADRILIYPTYAIFNVVSNRDESTVEVFDFRNGALKGNSLNRRSRSDRTIAFPFSSVDFRKLPKWIETAKNLVGQGAIITHISIEEYNLETGPLVQIYMNLNGETRWASMDTNAGNATIR